MTSHRTTEPTRRIAAALAALIGGLALLVVPGTASGAVTDGAQGTTFSALHAPAAASPQQRPNTNGVNWSGYVATGASFRSVSAAWTAPAVRCNSPSDVMGPWVGIGGVATTAVEQTGMEISCASGRPAYRAWSEMAPAAPVYYRGVIRQGDALRAEVRRTGSTYELIISNTTRNWTERVTRTAHGDNATAEVILESPTGAFPDFGTFTFTSATVDGKAMSAHRTVALDANSGAGFQNHTGPLSKSTFSIRYLKE
jgi:hypothetical protein